MLFKDDLGDSVTTLDWEWFGTGVVEEYDDVASVVWVNDSSEGGNTLSSEAAAWQDLDVCSIRRHDGDIQWDFRDFLWF
jgi:hypothetical protein